MTKVTDRMGGINYFPADKEKSKKKIFKFILFILFILSSILILNNYFKFFKKSGNIVIGSVIDVNYFQEQGEEEFQEQDKEIENSTVKDNYIESLDELIYNYEAITQD